MSDLTPETLRELGPEILIRGLGPARGPMRIAEHADAWEADRKRLAVLESERLVTARLIDFGKEPDTLSRWAKKVLKDQPDE